MRAAEDEDREKLIKSCPLCRGMGPYESSMEAQTNWQLDLVERLINERTSGRSLDMKEMDPLTWELIVAWDRVELEYRLAHEKRITALFEALMQRAQGV